MTELRNVEMDLARFRARIFVVSLVVLGCFLLLIARLVYLQVWRHDDLREQAESNRTSIVPIVPNRGLITDRNGIILANVRVDDDLAGHAATPVVRGAGKARRRGLSR